MQTTQVVWRLCRILNGIDLAESGARDVRTGDNENGKEREEKEGARKERGPARM